ncbi:MAG: gamma-glutamyl-gamma-aminobutyrate hydrolase family protein [Bacteroidota bacterium]
MGVTDCLNDDKYGLYANWIHAIDTTVDIVKISYRESNAEKVTALDGLLITGGGDVHPRFYSREDHLNLTEDVDDHAGSKQHPKTHAVAIHPYSLLKEVAGSTEAVVNSHHHQAVKDLGRGLVASAVSADGVVEAAEWVMKDGMPFLMLVQWHPERDMDQTNVFSKNLASLFLREAQHSKRTKATKGSVHNG